jgi:hypothetical protein
MGEKTGPIQARPDSPPTLNISHDDGEADVSKGHEYAPEDIREQALGVLNNTPEARARERAYLWKLDCIILPTISALYFFEYIDRGNIAVSLLQMLTRSLVDHLTVTECKTPWYRKWPRYRRQWCWSRPEISELGAMANRHHDLLRWACPVSGSRMSRVSGVSTVQGMAILR